MTASSLRRASSSPMPALLLDLGFGPSSAGWPRTSPAPSLWTRFWTSGSSKALLDGPGLPRLQPPRVCRRVCLFREPPPQTLYFFLLLCILLYGLPDLRELPVNPPGTEFPDASARAFPAEYSELTGTIVSVAFLNNHWTFGTFDFSICGFTLGKIRVRLRRPVPWYEVFDPECLPSDQLGFGAVAPANL